MVSLAVGLIDLLNDDNTMEALARDLRFSAINQLNPSPVSV